MTPRIYAGDYHAKIKQKILGKENSYPKLVLPKKTSTKLGSLIDKQRSYKKNNLEFINSLQKICEDWVKDNGSPFDMVLAQNGKILFHDSFGSDDYGVFTINTPTEIASITKLFTGVLFAQFVDQNIIGIDDPVGKYLPDFPIEGPKAVTMRHCFTHTSGFDGHGKFGGVHNPWLENTLFHTVKSELVGKIYNYNGMGFDLSVMASSIQCLRNPNLALENMLNMSKKTIVTLPNFGYWKCRLGLLKGSMPITDNLPKTWYETNNLHLCTIKDFESGVLIFANWPIAVGFP